MATEVPLTRHTRQQMPALLGRWLVSYPREVLHLRCNWSSVAAVVAAAAAAFARVLSLSVYPLAGRADEKPEKR